jgi:hypothetical protein
MNAYEDKLTRKEAAKRIGKSAHWLATKGKRLGVPCFLIGGTYYYVAKELDAWWEDQRYSVSNYGPVRSSGYVIRQKVSL